MEEKSKITRRLSSVEREQHFRERESSGTYPRRCSDYLAGRQIPARLTFSSKNEKKKKEKDKDISPGQDLVFRILGIISPCSSHSRVILDPFSSSTCSHTFSPLCLDLSLDCDRSLLAGKRNNESGLVLLGYVRVTLTNATMNMISNLGVTWGEGGTDGGGNKV